MSYSAVRFGIPTTRPRWRIPAQKLQEILDKEAKLREEEQGEPYAHPLDFSRGPIPNTHTLLRA